MRYRPDSSPPIFNRCLFAMSACIHSHAVLDSRMPGLLILLSMVMPDFRLHSDRCFDSRSIRSHATLGVGLVCWQRLLQTPLPVAAPSAVTVSNRTVKGAMRNLVQLLEACRLQPNAATCDRQSVAWQALILQYCQSQKARHCLRQHPSSTSTAS